MSSIQKRVSCERPSGCGIVPLPVGEAEPVVEILLVFGLYVDFQRHDAEDGVVHVVALGDAGGFRAAGHERIELA